MVTYAPSDLIEQCPPVACAVSGSAAGEVEGLIVAPGRRPPAEKLKHMRETDAKFEATWQKRRPDLPDESQSGYDYALMARAALAGGWSDQEIIDLCIAHREKHGEPIKRPDYFLRSLVRAKAGAVDATSRKRLQNGPQAAIGEVVSTSTLPWKPFPLEVFPAPLRRFITEGARAIGCEEINLVIPILVMLAGAVGNTRRIQIKRGWLESAILWSLLIGPSGLMRKSPALDLAARPIFAWQAKQLRKWKRAMDSHLKKQHAYAADLSRWKQVRKKGENLGEEPPEAPKKPFLPRLVVSDTTIEALAPILEENPRGVVLVRDEEAGWIRGFNQYKAGGQGGDVPLWLEAHRGGPWLKDRRTDREVLSVPRAAISVTGTTQPGIARSLFRPEYFECGLAARLLLTAPPPRKRVWTDDEVSEAAEQEYAEILGRLQALRFAPKRAADEPADHGGATPIDLPLTPEARERFARFVNEHGERTAEVDEDTGAAFAKLEGYAARFALVLHLVDAVCGVPGVDDQGPVGLPYMEAGIVIAQWFAYETERVYAMLRETDEERARRELVERIRGWGGTAGTRDLMRHIRHFRTAEQAEKALQDLVRHDLGRWSDRPSQPKGGQPTRVLELLDPAPDDTVDVDTTPESPGVDGVLSTSTPQENPPPPPAGPAPLEASLSSAVEPTEPAAPDPESGGPTVPPRTRPGQPRHLFRDAKRKSRGELPSD